MTTPVRLARKRTIQIVVSAGVLAVSSPGWISGAFGASPWLHLSASARPSALQAGQAKDEVQQVTVSATSREFTLIETARFRSASFKVNASPAEVQTGLEGVYGTGNVQVSGGPGGSSPYQVTFTGGLADQAVEPMLGLEAAVAELVQGSADGKIVLMVSNVGDEPANGEITPLRITDALPPGLRAVSVEGVAGESTTFSAGNRGPVQCTAVPLECTFAGTLPPYDGVEVRMGVLVGSGYLAGGQNETTASGGQAPSARHVQPTGQATSRFGVEDYELSAEEEGGAIDTQAGSHPFQLTTNLTFDQTAEANPVELPKDANVRLPPGLVGNVTGLTHCTVAAFVQFTQTGSYALGDRCPARAAVGVAQVTANVKPGVGLNTFTVPVFSLEPGQGEPARFGFYLPEDRVAVTLDTAVRSGEDYGVTVSADNIPETVASLQSQITLWGTPQDPRHDHARGWECLRVARTGEGTCAPSEETGSTPLLTMPGSCNETLRSSVQVNSWQAPGTFASATGAGEPITLDGCNREPFTPSVSVATEKQTASTPTGLSVDVHVPQEASNDPGGVAEADVKNTTVTLPAGLQVNPAAAAGLQACSEADVGYERTEAGGPAIFSEGGAGCPEASKLGTVKITSPLLSEPLEGAVYQAAQDANPFGSLLALYVVAN